MHLNFSLQYSGFCTEETGTDEVIHKLCSCAEPIQKKENNIKEKKIETDY